jgi:hypothetical protein
MNNIKIKKYDIGFTEKTFSHYISLFQEQLRAYGDVDCNTVKDVHKRLINVKMDGKKYPMVIKEEDTNQSNSILEITFNFRKPNLTSEDINNIVPKVENIFKDIFPNIQPAN